MKRKTTQSGSLHVVIIAVLFVALMATLGIVFYQNFVAKKASDTPKETTQNVSKTSTDETARVAFNSDIYAIDHPKNWKVTTVKLEKSTMGGSVTTIVNADGTVQATVTVTEIAPDTACNKDDDLKLSAYYVDATAFDRLAGVPLYLVETISDNTGGGYQYKIGLTPDGGDTHAVVGQTHCNIMQVGVASTAVFEKKKLIHPTIQATIDFPKLPATPKAASKDMQTIKDFMSTEDYKAAVKTLESARKE